MHKSHLTEADIEDMQRLQAIAVRPAERERLRRLGLYPAAQGWPVHPRECGKDCEVDCGDRQKDGPLH